MSLKKHFSISQVQQQQRLVRFEGNLQANNEKRYDI